MTAAAVNLQIIDLSSSDSISSANSIRQVCWKKINLSDCALALNLDEDFVEKVGAMNKPRVFFFDFCAIQVIWDQRMKKFMVLLLIQIMAWSHSLHPMEFLDFRSTLHRVMPAGQERYSVALFMSPNEDCVVECLKSWCSEESPPRFPPVRSGDYLEERFRLTHAT